MPEDPLKSPLEELVAQITALNHHFQKLENNHQTSTPDGSVPSGAEYDAGLPTIKVIEQFMKGMRDRKIESQFGDHPLGGMFGMPKRTWDTLKGYAPQRSGEPTSSTSYPNDNGSSRLGAASRQGADMPAHQRYNPEMYPPAGTTSGGDTVKNTAKDEAQSAGQPGPTSSTPNGLGGSSALDGLFGKSGAAGVHVSDMGFDPTHPDKDILTLAMLGEHGSPKFLQNLAFDAFKIQRFLKWSQGSANSNLVQGTIGKTGIGSSLLQGISGAAEIGLKNPELAYAIGKPLMMGYQGMKNASEYLGNAQQVGQMFGYGPPPLGQNIFGYHNPLGIFTSATDQRFANEKVCHNFFAVSF